MRDNTVTERSIPPTTIYLLRSFCSLRRNKILYVHIFRKRFCSKARQVQQKSCTRKQLNAAAKTKNKPSPNTYSLSTNAFKESVRVDFIFFLFHTYIFIYILRVVLIYQYAYRDANAYRTQCEQQRGTHKFYVFALCEPRAIKPNTRRISYTKPK